MKVSLVITGIYTGSMMVANALKSEKKLCNYSSGSVRKM